MRDDIVVLISAVNLESCSETVVLGRPLNQDSRLDSTSRGTMKFHVEMADVKLASR